MEAHNSFFTNSAGPAFNSTHYHFGHPFATYDTWSLSHLDVVPHATALLTLSPLLPPDDSFQMQHLRFPTPPITPPFGSVTLQNAQALSALAAASSPVSPSPTRTQSVIMKIDQHTPAGNAAFDSCNVSCHKQPSEAACSENPSPKNLEYRCDWIDCNRYHNSLDSLVAHVTKVHAVASPMDGLYYCRWFGCTRARGFSARYKMLVHARTHTKEKPHQCQLCTKSFSRAENLKIHIRSHSGEKPYLCTYKGCHKAYSNSSDRFKHTRTHAMDKPYMCKVPGCQKRYTDPSSLRKHVKTFKHNVQLIRTTTATYMSNNSTAVSTQLTKSSPTTSFSTTAVNRHRSSKYSPSTVLHQHLHTEPEEQIPAYQLGSPPRLTTIGAHTPQFYVGSLEEDVCHIKATQLDYYYAAANGTVTPPNSITPSYGIAQKSRNDESIMDLETPLDLRLHRS